MPCIFHYYFLKGWKLVVQTTIYYSVCGSRMWTVLVYFILIWSWPCTWVPINPVLPWQGSWVFSHDFYTLCPTRKFLWQDELVFCCCIKTPWPRTLTEERIDLDWWFQRVRVQEGRGRVAAGAGETAGAAICELRSWTMSTKHIEEGVQNLASPPVHI